MHNTKFLCSVIAFIFLSIKVSAQKADVIGPLVGHTDANTSHLWARLPISGTYTLEVRKSDTKNWKAFKSEAKVENDLCVTWKMENLKPSTSYHYRLKKNQEILKEGNDLSFKTAPLSNTKTEVHLAFGSCADTGKGNAKVWDRIAKSNIDALVLLGDTPYLDITDRAIQREKQRNFVGFNPFQNLVKSIPFWDSWDDHDFTVNDSDGTHKGKHTTLKVFKEYRALASYGNGKEGVYTSFEYGPVEVFLLDTRWWSWTGPSFADPTKKTLLGKEQWEWLKKGLKNSKATFKIIACGMIWDDKKNKEKDDWETYAHERTALFDFIGKQKISGVVLIGGDIHVSRALRYPTNEQVGYPLYQFITSPLHNRTIKSLNVPHPNLIRDAVVPNTFLRITADTKVSPAVLRAEFIDKDGVRLFDDISITEDQLTPKKQE